MKIALTSAPTAETVLARTIGGLLRDAGHEIEFFTASSGEARRMSSVHEGVADLSVGVSTMVRWAYRSEAGYDGWRHTSLRLLTALQRPVWFVLAARGDLGPDVLTRGDHQPGLRMLCYPPDGHSAGWAHLLAETLQEAGTGFDAIRDAGGRLLDVTVQGTTFGRDDVDVVALPYGLPGLDQAAWARATTLLDLQPLAVGEALATVARRYDLGLRPPPVGGSVPAGAPPTLFVPTTFVFASERLADDVAEAVVGVLHDHRDALLAEGYALDPSAAFDPGAGLRYHRAAIGYYRQAGVLPQPA